MRKLLGTITLLVVILLGVGYVRGWFSLTSGSADNKTKIEVTIDKDRVKADANTVKQKVKDLTDGGSTEEMSEETSEEAPE